jgi:quercetin dioxygenase-like cupin family protein
MMIRTTRRSVLALTVAAICISVACASGKLAPHTTNEIAPEATTPEQTTSPNLPDPLAAGWQGEKVCERLHEDESQRILRCTFPPGVGHERHFHVPHFGYVIAGSVMRITDESGTREVEIATGSSWANDGADWHEVINVGETTGVYLIVEPK